MATGSQWDLVQAYAWVRMTVDNSRTMSLTDAVKKTFDGEMCGVCKVVNSAKQQENNATVPGGKPNTKIVLFFQPTEGVRLNAPDLEAWSFSDRAFVSVARSAPPLPPPRA